MNETPKHSPKPSKKLKNIALLPGETAIVLTTADYDDFKQLLSEAEAFTGHPYQIELERVSTIIEN